MLESLQGNAEEPQKPLFVDKKLLRQAADEIIARLSMTWDDVPTAEEARRIRDGMNVRPEDNVFSRAIIAERYPDEDVYAEDWE